MKTQRFYKVATTVDLTFKSLDIDVRNTQIYFCEHIYTEAADPTSDILTAIKKLKDCSIKMITIDLTQSEFVGAREKTLRSVRYITAYNCNKAAEFKNERFDFDNEDTITELTPAAFVKRYAKDLNKQAHFEYMRTLTE